MKKDRPKVLIIDRSQLESRVLEELLRPMADVIVRNNVWTAVRTLDSERESLSAVFVEASLLRTSSISDHWRGAQSRKGCLQIYAISDTDADLVPENLKRFAVSIVIRKPYDSRVLSNLIFR